MDKFVYLDNAATTSVLPEVFEAMKPYFTEIYSNPMGIYSFASKSKDAIENSRESIAKILGAKPNEIYFTAGGSEANNWAIKGIAEGYSKKGNHIITSKIEHDAIINTCKYLEKQGFEVSYIDVDEKGVVNLQQLKAAIRPTTILISVMFANNEIGTLQPIKEIGDLAHQNNIIFHTDAVQAFCHEKINVDELHIDLLSASGQKFGGPKGIGFLYVRNKIKIEAFIHGGSQEADKRAGTQNVPGIVGMGKAAEITTRTMEKRNEYEAELRDYLIERVMNEIPYTILNGHRTNRLSNNASFCFRFIEGESLLMLLDQKGICGSSGSACTSGSLDPSHVLLAIGLPHEIAHGSLRLSLSEDTTKADIDYVIDELKIIIARLRSMSPLYADFIKKGEAV